MARRPGSSRGCLLPGCSFYGCHILPPQYRFHDRSAVTVLSCLQVPPEFPEWTETMDMWGEKMLEALQVLAGMAATGLGLEPTAFQDMMHCGPHLLAPTGSDFSKFTEVSGGQVPRLGG